MRAIFWGMNGIFTWTVLETLLDAGILIVAVMVDGSLALRTKSEGAYARLMPPALSDVELPLLASTQVHMQPNTVNRAWRAGLPVYAIHELNSSETVTLMDSLQADVACVACYPRRLPKTLLDLPQHGFLNVHPSLLPDYRGPAPLFWQLRDGVNPIGVTVHWMDEGFDTGNLAAQESVNLPTGVDGPGADRLLAQLGGLLLVETLAKLEDGTARRRPQPAGGSYHPLPTVSDFQLNRRWSAHHAFNFMRGAAEWGVPFTVDGPDGEVVRVRQALFYLPQETVSAPYRRENAQISIQFSPGVVLATPA